MNIYVYELAPETEYVYVCMYACELSPETESLKSKLLLVV